MAKLFGTLFGKDAGKIAGVLSVFALSGWLHHQGTIFPPRSKLVLIIGPPAICSATHDLPSRPSLPFFEAYGAPLFFLAQAVAILVESYFMRWTGKKLHGIGAVMWTYAVVVGFGCWAARSWVRRELFLVLPYPLSFSLRSSWTRRLMRSHDVDCVGFGRWITATARMGLAEIRHSKRGITSSAVMDCTGISRLIPIARSLEGILSSLVALYYFCKFIHNSHRISFDRPYQHSLCEQSNIFPPHSRQFYDVRPATRREKITKKWKHCSKQDQIDTRLVGSTNETIDVGSSLSGLSIPTETRSSVADPRGCRFVKTYSMKVRNFRFRDPPRG